MKRNTRRISTPKMHSGLPARSKLAAARAMLVFKLSLHKRRAMLIVLLGALCAAVLAPSVIRLPALTTAASTASTQQGVKQGAPELRASPRAGAALQRLQSETGGRVVSHLSNKTGNFDFVRATGDAFLAAHKGSGTPEERAKAFLGEHGAVAGLSDAELRRVAAGDSPAGGPSSELRVVRVDRDNIGSEHVRFNQFYQGLPVFGAQLIVHMSARGITAVNGDFVPDLKFAAAPRISAKEAGQIALRYQLAGAPLSVVKTELSIYRVGLLEGYRGPSVLAYGVEVTDRRAGRDQIWINANSGKLINRIPLNHKALERRIYSPDYDPDNPDMFLVKQEGDPILPGPPPGTTGANPIDNLYVFAGQTYNLFASAFGRDSYDGLGHRMASVYLVNDACPNAYWNGVATNYCPDLDADDVVAHEWGHAYTQFTHGLIYAYQSGALNESYSDIFGEVVDLHNGVDAEGGSNNAQPLPDGQRWQVGDDVPTLNNEELDILRDMWDPTRYGQPDKVSSANYSCGSGDGGGVHANSGVPNHAFAMLVDGKTFNGQTVQGIGFTKALHIYFRAMTVYQTPTTDFPAHDQALQASCADLAQAGTNLNALSTDSANSVPSGQVVTANDCLQVAKAMLAVEMSMPSPCPVVILLDPNPPDICLGATDIFAENWETGMDGWTLTSTGVFADWEDSSRSVRDFTINSTLPAGRSGSAAYARNAPVGQPGGGDCTPGSQDYSGQFTIDSPTITIPAGATTLNLSFDHYVATEATFDGGQVEISVNGGAFALVAQENYLHNPPNSQFDAAPPVGLNTNPNAGEFAWHGTNIGTPSTAPPGSWGTTLVDLSSLAAPGNTIKIRFTYSQDGCNGVDGWYVDNVRVFRCPTLEAPTLSIGADYENPDTNGSYTFNWIRPAGATGPDVLQESSTSCAPLLSDDAGSGLGQWTVFSSAFPPTLITWDNPPANSKPLHNSATFWGHGAEQETQNTFTTLTYNNAIPIPNSGTTTLNFSDWYFNEDDDNGFVEVSTDNGATWTQVYSAFRAMGDLPDVGANAFANETLTDRSVNLSIYSGQSIRLRFRYECGASNFYLFIQYGWHIDNISIANESWQDVTTINATTFTVTGRGPGTRCYRVRTTYTLGSQSVPSPYSNVVSATVVTGGCQYTLNPTSDSFPASGGSDTVSVTTTAGCNWTATTNTDFITINSGSSGTGSGTVNYTVASNPNASSRSGSMTIAGQTFIVTQAGTGSKSISGTISYCIDPSKKVPNATVNTTAGAPSASASSNSSGFYQLTGLDAGAYTVTPSKTGAVTGITAFDAALVAQFVAGVVPAPNNCQTLAGDASNSGALSALDAAYIAQTVAEISNPGIAGTWKFVPSSRSYSSVDNDLPNENYDAVLVGDVSGNWTPAGPQGPSQPPKVSIPVSLPNTTAGKGSTNVIVPVSVGNTTGLNVLAYAFTFTFDPSVIQVANPAFETSGTLSRGWNITANTSTPGRIRIVAFNSRPLSGSGTLIFVKFNVVGPKGAMTPLTWTNFPFNEGNPGATLTNGTLKVKKQASSSTSSLLPVTTNGRPDLTPTISASDTTPSIGHNAAARALAGNRLPMFVMMPRLNHCFDDSVSDSPLASSHVFVSQRSHSPWVKPAVGRSPPHSTPTLAARGFSRATRLPG